MTLVFKNDDTEKVRAEGTVKFFVSEKGWGIIKSDKAGEIFFHMSGLEFPVNEMKEGLVVEFTLDKNSRGPIAKEIRKLEDKI